MAEDPHGFHEFAAARGASLFRTACLMCGDPHLAEDLVQTTLGKLYASWRRVRRAEYLLRYTTLPIKAVASQVGLGDFHSFNKAMRRVTGLAPRQARQNKTTQ